MLKTKPNKTKQIKIILLRFLPRIVLRCNLVELHPMLRLLISSDTDSQLGKLYSFERGLILYYLLVRAGRVPMPQFYLSSILETSCGTLSSQKLLVSSQRKHGMCMFLTVFRLGKAYRRCATPAVSFRSFSFP